MKTFLRKALHTLTLLFLGSISLPAQAQFPSQMWHKGTIYGIDGQTYDGLVKYDLENNVVQLQAETISTFPAFTISHFEILNETSEVPRIFYRIPYRPNGDVELAFFFEVLTEGKDVSFPENWAIQKFTFHPISEGK